MNGLINLFAIGVIIGMVGILVGRKRPGLVLWGDENARTKRKAFQVYGLITMISFSLFALVAPEEASVREKSKNSSEIASSASAHIVIMEKTKSPVDHIPQDSQVECWIDCAETVVSDKDPCISVVPTVDSFSEITRWRPSVLLI